MRDSTVRFGIATLWLALAAAFQDIGLSAVNPRTHFFMALFFAAVWVVAGLSAARQERNERVGK